MRAFRLHILTVSTPCSTDSPPLMLWKEHVDTTIETGCSFIFQGHAYFLGLVSFSSSSFESDKTYLKPKTKVVRAQGRTIVSAIRSVQLSPVAIWCELDIWHSIWARGQHARLRMIRLCCVFPGLLAGVATRKTSTE